jgi:hypothetical protein
MTAARSNPQFPIYIVSKGRAKSRLTSKFFEKVGVPYRVVIEEQEHADYAAVIDPKKLLVLDKAYQRDYDTFSELGAEKGTGSGPARNFAWDHALSLGAPWHWVGDDNIERFYRLDRNVYGEVMDGTIFRCMEDFCGRYANVGMAGPNYFMWAPRKNKMPPFVMNTRIYSFNLIRSDLPFRWRGRYNEDTDLSLRMLKAQWCTILFNAFLQHKSTTLKMKGGNTDSIYTDGTLAKSKMIVDMHPDVARLTLNDRRFNRPHHMVDYSSFKNIPLIRKEGVRTKGADEYGMVRVDKETAAPWTKKGPRVAPEAVR